MHFFTLFAATIATFTTAAIAAPSPCSNCTGPVKPDPVDSKPESSNTTVPVGSTPDLNPDTPLCSLSCTDTFAEKFPKFHNLGQLPSAPFYGQIPGAVDGSPKCGSCWKLQYCDKPPVYMIAVDNAAIIQLGGDAFKKFAAAEGAKKGSVNATVVEVDPSFCDLC